MTNEFLNCDLLSHLRPFLCAVHSWQTLIGAAMASIAAYLTVRKIKAQINQVESHRQDRLDREHAAIRVVLSFTLSEISDYLYEVGDYILNQRKRTNNSLFAAKTSPVPLPNLPYTVQESLRDFTATLSDKSMIRHVSELTTSLQTINSRLTERRSNGINFQMDLTDTFILCGKAKMLNDSMFNYSRMVDEGSFSLFDDDDENGVWENINRACTSLLFARADADHFLAPITQAVERRKENRTSPWFKKMS